MGTSKKLVCWTEMILERVCNKIVWKRLRPEKNIVRKGLRQGHALHSVLFGMVLEILRNSGLKTEETIFHNEYHGIDFADEKNLAENQWKKNIYDDGIYRRESDKLR